MHPRSCLGCVATGIQFAMETDDSSEGQGLTLSGNQVPVSFDSIGLALVLAWLIRRKRKGPVSVIEHRQSRVFFELQEGCGVRGPRTLLGHLSK